MFRVGGETGNTGILLFGFNNIPNVIQVNI